ncbi:MAG: hypothetical protein DRJ45_06220 [Thermoprotei archaeon]|nr:MAG: hypothetical protein DRJ45_06220 [Thermoprotei archaeon]
MIKIAFIGPLEKERIRVLEKILNRNIGESKEFLSLYNFKIDSKSIQIWNFKWNRQANIVFNLMKDTYNYIFVFFRLSNINSLKVTDEWISSIKNKDKIVYIGVNGEKIVNVDSIKRFLNKVEVNKYIEIDLDSKENIYALKEMITNFEEKFILLASRKMEKPLVREISGVTYKGELVTTPVIISYEGIDDLSGEERLIFRLCNGENTIEEIAKKLSLPRIRVALVIKKLVRKKLVKEIMTLR